MRAKKEINHLIGDTEGKYPFVLQRLKNEGLRVVNKVRTNPLTGQREIFSYIDLPKGHSVTFAGDISTQHYHSRALWRLIKNTRERFAGKVHTIIGNRDINPQYYLPTVQERLDHLRQDIEELMEWLRANPEGVFQQYAAERVNYTATRRQGRYWIDPKAKTLLQAHLGDDAFQKLIAARDFSAVDILDQYVSAHASDATQIDIQYLQYAFANRFGCANEFLRREVEILIEQYEKTLLGRLQADETTALVDQLRVEVDAIKRPQLPEQYQAAKQLALVALAKLEVKMSPAEIAAATLASFREDASAAGLATDYLRHAEVIGFDAKTSVLSVHGSLPGMHAIQFPLAENKSGRVRQQCLEQQYRAAVSRKTPELLKIIARYNVYVGAALDALQKPSAQRSRFDYQLMDWFVKLGQPWGNTPVCVSWADHDREMDECMKSHLYNAGVKLIFSGHRPAPLVAPECVGGEFTAVNADVSYALHPHQVVVVKQGQALSLHVVNEVQALQLGALLDEGFILESAYELVDAKGNKVRNPVLEQVIKRPFNIGGIFGDKVPEQITALGSSDFRAIFHDAKADRFLCFKQGGPVVRFAKAAVWVDAADLYEVLKVDLPTQAEQVETPPRSSSSTPVVDMVAGLGLFVGGKALNQGVSSHPGEGVTRSQSAP